MVGRAQSPPQKYLEICLDRLRRKYLGPEKGAERGISFLTDFPCLRTFCCGRVGQPCPQMDVDQLTADIQRHSLNGSQSPCHMTPPKPLNPSPHLAELGQASPSRSGVISLAVPCSIRAHARARARACVCVRQNVVGVCIQPQVVHSPT